MRTLIAAVLVILIGCSTVPPNERADDDAQVPPEIDVSSLERLIHANVNAARSSHALGALIWNDSLATIARGHSRDLGESEIFSHTGSDGSLPSDRALRAGYDCRKDVGEIRFTGIAENIFMTYVYRSRRTMHGPGGTSQSFDWKTAEEIAADVVDGWMGSPGHRANILEARHDREGVGIVRIGDQLYITQNLC